MLHAFDTEPLQGFEELEGSLDLDGGPGGNKEVEDGFLRRVVVFPARSSLRAPSSRLTCPDHPIWHRIVPEEGHSGSGSKTAAPIGIRVVDEEHMTVLRPIRRLVYANPHKVVEMLLCEPGGTPRIELWSLRRISTSVRAFTPCRTSMSRSLPR